MDLTEALLNRYTNSVVSILNAVRGPTHRTKRLGRPAVSVSRSQRHDRPVSSMTRPPPGALSGDGRGPRTARSRDARASSLAPRFDSRLPRSPRTPHALVPASRVNKQQTSRLAFFLPTSSRVVDRIEQGPAGAASDPSFALGSLKDLLPALAALAPAGASRLVDALLTWYHQHRRAVAAQTGSTWHARVLELAFWHAAHGVLSPLPPRALPTRDVALVADAAFEAILNTTAPAPPWDKWGSDAGEFDSKAFDDGERDGRRFRRRDGGATTPDDDGRAWRRTERAGGTERASRDDDAYPDAYARESRARTRQPPRASPRAGGELAGGRSGAWRRAHDPAAAAEKSARELAPRTRASTSARRRTR